MAIATYWHYGKANLDESELLENTGLSDLYQPLKLLLTKTMKLPCITRREFEEENWAQLFLSIDFKLNPTDSSLFRVFVFLIRIASFSPKQIKRIIFFRI